MSEINIIQQGIMRGISPIGQAYPITRTTAWKSRTGVLPIKMTNDYLFRALLQSDNETLKALTAALLHMKISDIKTIVIENPIMLGESVNDKYYILDIKVSLNNNTIINIELQVIHEKGWENRSVGYLCRIFDNLNRGQDYIESKPAIHIGILDFILFKDEKEFRSTYKLMNVHTYKIYTDKIQITTIELGRIGLATEEDKKYHLDEWAKLFKAKTWEELKMLAQANTNISNAISTIFQLTEEELIAEQCRQRDAYLERRRIEMEENKLKDDLLSQQQEQLRQQQNELRQKDEQLSEKDEQLNRQQTELDQKNEKIKKQNEEIERLRSLIAKNGIS